LIFSPVILFLTLLLVSCAPVEIINPDLPDNMLPPKITGFSNTESRRMEFCFSKEIASPESGEDFVIMPAPGNITAEADGTSVIIFFSEDQIPGFEYFIKGRVKDKRGNTLSFSTKFYGFNPRIPEMVINEFTTNGSASHPDMVEIFVKTKGDMAGAMFYSGCGCEHDQEFVFPAFEVNEGEYIIIHTKPQNIPAEIDETGEAGTSNGPDSSGGLDSSENARDFWIRGGSGLSGNNGALTLYASSGGRLIDAVIYSNRTSLSDEKYRGFGSSAMVHKADCISDAGGWVYNGEMITPEDCVNPENSTATRSICRNSASEDTDAKDDWHIVPTSSFTFGRVNSDEVYPPKE
ncbi:MAG: hypothetical protein RBT69_12515, partial [Spirochaetia bacterium]|nr:hypothetical protein [Spirochaetia bacterium]